MKEDITKKIYDIMETKFTKGIDNIFWYEKTWQVKKLEGKTLTESFFVAHPDLAAEYFDQIFDEIHPY